MVPTSSSSAAAAAACCAASGLPIHPWVRYLLIVSGACRRFMDGTAAVTSARSRVTTKCRRR